MKQGKERDYMTVEGLEIRFHTDREQDYSSLTDFAKRSSVRPEQGIQNWLRNRNTIEFLALWTSAV